MIQTPPLKLVLVSLANTAYLETSMLTMFLGQLFQLFQLPSRLLSNIHFGGSCTFLIPDHLVNQGTLSTMSGRQSDYHLILKVPQSALHIYIFLSFLQKWD